MQQIRGAAGLNGLFDPATVQQYTLAINGLNAQEALAVLQKQGMSKAQQEQILSSAGLLSTTQALNASLVEEAVLTSNISGAKAEAILTELNVIDAKTGNLIATNECTVAEVAQALATQGVVGADAEAILSQLNLTTANTATTASFAGLTTAIKATAATIGNWLMTNPMGWCLMAGGAIYGLIKAYDTFTVSEEETRQAHEESIESIKQSLSDYEALDQELESIKTQYQENADKLEELYRLRENQTITQAENDYLQELENQNEELQRQIEYEETLQRIKGQDTENDAIETLKEETEDGDATAGRMYGIAEPEKITELEKVERNTQNINSRIADLAMYKRVLNGMELTQQERDSISGSLEAVKEEIASGLFTQEKQVSKDTYEALLNGTLTYEQYEKAVASTSETIQDLITSNDSLLQHIEPLNDAIVSTTGENYEFKVSNDQIIANAKNAAIAFNAFEASVTDTADTLASVPENTISFTGIFNSTDFSDTREQLLELARSGELTADTISSTDAYAGLLKETGASAEDAKAQILGMLTPTEKLAAASKGLNSLKDAYSEFTDNGFVSASTLDDLPDVFKELEGYDLFSQISGNPASGNEKIQQAFNEIAQQYLISQKTLTGLIHASEDEIQSYIANLKASGITNADTLVNQTLAALDTTTKLFDDAEQEYYSMYLNYIRGKGDLDSQYLTSTASNNGRLAEALGSAYQADYDNWCNLLGEKATAYNDFITALGGSYDPSKSVIQNMQDNGQTISANTIAEASAREAAYRRATEQANAAKSTLKLDYAKIKTNFGTPSLSSSSGSGAASEAAQETAETFNWLETLLTRIQRKVTNFGKTVSSVWQNWTTRGIAATQQLAAIREELTAQQQAYDAYLAKADSVGLSGYYQDLVKNGSINIEDITDDGLKEQIKAFQEWYEKALAASDSIADLKDNLAELAKTRFENVSKEFEGKLSLIENETDLINNRLEQAEAKGYLVSGSYYDALIAREGDILTTLRQKHDALQSSLTESLASGQIEAYSEAWYDKVGDIQKVAQAIGDAELSIINYKNRRRELDWDLFDRSQEQMAQIPKESDFLLSLMEDSDLYDESGSFNRLGNAAAGLHAVSLNTYMARADDYAKEIDSINRELAEDPYNTILLDRRQELLDSQQDMISSAEDERQAIKDLVSDGYSRMLDFLSDIIDKRKEALQAEKDLYDYQKSIAEQTKAVSTYEKQLAAFSGDDSEETKNTIQQIRVSLEEAKQGLEDTEYDKWLSDQEQLLDRLQNDTEEWVNARLDDIDGLIQEVIDSTNENAGEIKETLDGLGEKVGYSLSENMEEIWKKDGGVGQVVSQYSQNFSLHATTVQRVLAEIRNSLQEMNGASKKQAEADITGIQQGTASLPGISGAPSASPDTGSPSAPSSGSSSGGSDSSSSWGSWFVQKKDSYPKSKLNTETSIVDRLKSLDLDSSFSQRKRYYSAMGGSGTYTGSAAQNTWMLEQMKLHGYAEGSSGIPEDRLAWTQEKGDELIYRASDGAMLTPLGKGDMVFTSEMTKRLWDLSKLPSVRPSLPPIPTLQDVYLPVPENAGSHASGNVTVQIDNIEMNGVNDPEQFTQELTKALSCDRRVKQILVDETIGRSLGRNSLLSRSR